MTVKPFLKCLGGKTKLIPELVKHFPEELKNSDYTYVEPFLGGGSLFLHLATSLDMRPKNVFLRDYNSDVILAWKMVQGNAHRLVGELEALKNTHSEEVFNKIQKHHNLNNSNPLQASNFIYLNKTCFNGLTRYNSSGRFNSPYGKYKNPQIYDKENIRKVSELLQKGVKLSVGDFEGIVNTVNKKLNKNCFIYLDPPYLPISETSNFTSYTAKGFNVYDHYRIKTLMDYLTELGCKVLLSNSNSPLSKKIFNDYQIKEIKAPRSVSAKVKGRGLITELLIKNY